MRDAFAGIVHARSALGKEHPRVAAVVQNLSVHDPTGERLALVPSSVRTQLMRSDDQLAPLPSSQPKAGTNKTPKWALTLEYSPTAAAGDACSSPSSGSHEMIAQAAREAAAKRFPICALAQPISSAPGTEGVAASGVHWQRPGQLPPSPERGAASAGTCSVPSPPAHDLPPAASPDKSNTESLATRLARRRKERSEQRSPSSSVPSRPDASQSQTRADGNSPG